MADRKFYPDNDVTSSQTLISIKNQKRLLKEGAEKFNSNPKEWIEFLQCSGTLILAHQILPTPAEPEHLAEFLSNSPHINKKQLGDYISKQPNIEILKAFMLRYDFKGKTIDEALRLLLESFRLPGESQLIERTMEIFAS